MEGPGCLWPAVAKEAGMADTVVRPPGERGACVCAGSTNVVDAAAEGEGETTSGEAGTAEEAGDTSSYPGMLPALLKREPPTSLAAPALLTRRDCGLEGLASVSASLKGRANGRDGCAVEPATPSDAGSRGAFARSECAWGVTSTGGRGSSEALPTAGNAPATERSSGAGPLAPTLRW